METYLARAEHAEQQAHNARSPEERHAFHEIATLWRSLAAGKAARLATSGPDPKPEPGPT